MMRRLLSCLALFLVAGFCAKAQEVTFPPSQLLTSFKFTRLSGGIVLVSARLNDYPDTLNFLLDTGSGGISLDSATRDYLGATLTPSDITIKGIAGVRKVDFIRKCTLHLPGLDVENLDFHVIDYQILSEVYGLKIDGIIGYSFFRRYVVTIDYDSTNIKVYTAGSYNYPKRGQLLKPVFTTIPIARFNIEDAREYLSNFYFDTGAGLCMLLSEQFVNDSSFFQKKRKMVETQAEGMGGKMMMKQTVMKRIKLGKYRFRNVPTMILDDQFNVISYPSLSGLIGSDLLRRFNLVINYPAREIHLSPNSHYDDQFDYSYTGLAIYFIDGKVMVTDIMQNSPAEAAGFLPGDIILGIETDFSNNIRKYKDLLQNAGSKLRIVVIRNNQPRLLQLKVKSFR